MKYEALENFSGVISMVKGQVREIPNLSLANDLIKAGLIKKYVANSNESLKEELEKATIKINELIDENEKLKNLLEQFDNEKNDKKDDDSNPMLDNNSDKDTSKAKKISGSV